MRSDSVALLILSYNEVEGMRVIMPQIQREWLDEILIVDGGSTDGTIEYAREHGYPLIVQKEAGLGPAYNEGLANISSHIVVTFSPDGNSDPARLPELIRHIRGGYDVVTVSRYLDWARSEDDDAITHVGNWVFTKLYNLLYQQCVTDYLVMYRAFKRNIIGELGIGHKGISWQSQLMCRAARAGLRIGEIPGNEPPRIGGVRKMNPIRNGAAEVRMLAEELIRTRYSSSTS